MKIKKKIDVLKINKNPFLSINCKQNYFLFYFIYSNFVQSNNKNIISLFNLLREKDFYFCL